MIRPILRFAVAVVACAAALLTATCPIVASTPTPIIVIRQMNRTALPVVKGFLHIADRNDHPMLGLKSKNLQVTVDGRTAAADVQLRPVNAQTDPIAVVLVLDESGSMRGDALDSSKRAADKFIAALGSSDQIGVVSFDSTVRTRCPLTANHDAARRAVAAIEAGSDTALYDAIASAASVISETSLPRRVIIVLTDGKENASHLSEAEMFSRLDKVDAPVFAIGLGQDISKSWLSSLAGRYRGLALMVPAPKALTQVYQQIIQELSGEYAFHFRFLLPIDGSVYALAFTVNALSVKATALESFIATSGKVIPPPPPPHAWCLQWLGIQDYRVGVAVVLGFGGVLGGLLSLCTLLVLKRRRRKLTTKMIAAVVLLGLAVGICAGLGLITLLEHTAGMAAGSGL